MTELDWLQCNDPIRMLAFLRADPDARNTLLLTAACGDRLSNRLPDLCRSWFERAEQVAEGQMEPGRLNEDWETIEDMMATLDWRETRSRGRIYALLNILVVAWQSDWPW